MATAIALYNAPTDPEVFDSHYTSTHIPLAKTIPGLRSYRVSRGPVLTPSGPADYHLVAVLGIDSMSDLEAALASAEGQTVVADLARFATGGVTVLLFDDEED